MVVVLQVCRVIQFVDGGSIIHTADFKTLYRQPYGTPSLSSIVRPRLRLAHVLPLWRDHRRRRHALAGPAVTMRRREGLALRPRPAGLLALAGKPM